MLPRHQGQMPREGADMNEAESLLLGLRLIVPGSSSVRLLFCWPWEGRSRFCPLTKLQCVFFGGLTGLPPIEHWWLAFWQLD